MLPKIYRRAVRFPMLRNLAPCPRHPCRSSVLANTQRQMPAPTEGLADFVAIDKVVTDAETFLMSAVRLE